MLASKVIYIIDDDRDDQDFLIEVLIEIDSTFQCFTANNGQEGLQKLNNGLIPFPSLIFLDLNMPRFNGRRFLNEIKEDAHFASIPVIIYSTSLYQKDKDELKTMGVVAYVEKQADPFVLKELLSGILSSILSTN